MLNLGILVGGTRPGRRAPMVTKWVEEGICSYQRQNPGHFKVSLVDLADHRLPLLAERAPAMFGDYEFPATQAWSNVIAELDAFIFVTPEYNHSLPAVLKNAIDHLFAEWNDRAAGIVTYGVQGGVRAAEHLRQVLAEVKVATVRSQVALSLFDDFVIDDPLETGEIAIRPRHTHALETMLSELYQWGGALQKLRQRIAMEDATLEVPA